MERYRASAEEAPLDFRAVDVGDLLAEAVRTVGREEAPELFVDPSFTVEGDRVRLVQAFTNVIKNAYESYDGLKRSRRVEIRAILRGDEAEITVTDHGCGIADEDLSRIFANLGSRKPGGEGRGMPTFRKVIELEHNGDIAIDSRKGRGTRVTAKLPLTQGKEDPDERSPSRRPRHRG